MKIPIAVFRTTQAQIVSAAVFVTTLVCLRGIPMIRHDWDWPVERAGIFWWWLDRTSGWRLSDFGQPNAYPTLYIAASCKAILMTLCGPSLAFVAYVLISTVFLSFSAVVYAKSVRRESTDTIPAIVVWLASVNPWTYTQLVAGHVEMLWGLAAVFLALAALRRGEGILLAIAAVASLAQIQFFLIVCGCAIVYAVRTCRLSVPAFCLALFAPIAVAAYTEQSALSHIPFLLDWQKVQNIGVVQALALSGYAAGYARSAEWWSLGALVLLFASRAHSLRHLPKREILCGVALLCTIVVLIGGPGGPLGVVYGWAMMHVRILGIYRELYDLVGIVALLYITFIVRMRRLQRFAFVDVIAAALLAVGWLAVPPYTYFAAPKTIAAPIVPARDGRFALAPAFQPVQFRGAGNGIDPDAVAIDLLRAPLNSYFSTYPADAALAAFADRGDQSGIARLGAGDAFVRCDFATAPDAVLQAPDVAARPCRPVHRLVSNAAAFVQLRGQPAVAVLDHDWSGNLFGGDVIGDVHALSFPAQTQRAASDWVDARLEFSRKPAIAQGYGGVYTTSRAALELTHRPWLLLWVDGELRSENQSSGRLGGSFAWRRFDATERRFSCYGACLLIADASHPHLPLELPATAARAAVAIRCLLPALCEARVSPSAGEIIELNTRFDAGWHAFAAGEDLRHFPLDGFANAFAVPRAPGPQLVRFMHVPSMIESALELAVIALICAQAVRKRRIIVRVLCRS